MVDMGYEKLYNQGRESPSTKYFYGGGGRQKKFELRRKLSNLLCGNLLG